VLKAGDKDNEGNVIVIDTVTITVPQQLKPEGKVVSVQELELGKLADLGRDQPGHPKPQATKEFSPTKLVAQFQVVWDDKVDQCLRKFKPAIQFQVAYTAADVKNEWSACWTKSEKKEDCAKLAFDDHKGRWVVFSPDTKKHGYHVIGDENGGNLIVDTFSDYGDPHIAK